MNYNSVADIFAAGTANMTVIWNNIKQDDGVNSVTGVDWFNFKGVTASTIYVSGNSFMGFGANSEQLKVNRRDTAMWYLYREEGTLYNYYRFLKLRWRGYSHYSATDAASLLEYDVILWENGDISLHMVSIPTSNNSGTYSLVANSTYTYTVSTDSPDVTFYYADGVYSVANEISTIPAPYDRKYLIRIGTTLYTITDGAITPLETTELTAEVFRTYGFDELPTGNFAAYGEYDPEILYWHDSTDALPTLTASVTGLPPVPQVVVTNAQDMSDPTILGIESVTVDASDDVLWAISFDDGATWKAYDGTQWAVLEQENSGMNKETFEAIDVESWAAVVSGDHYRIRFVLMDTASYVTSLTIHYLNEEV